MSKYIKSYTSFTKEIKSMNGKSINEDLFGIGGAMKELFGKLWQKGIEEIKKLGKNPSSDQLKEWMEKNVLNPADDTYILKGVIDAFNKKPEANEQDCLDLIKNILDPQIGSLGKGGMQSLYDNLLKSLGKESATLDIVKFYMETIRNRAIKDFKYAGGPDLKVGTDAKVDDKKVIVDMKDQTHLPVYKKAIAAAQQDNKKRKQIAIDWVNKTLLTSLKKYFTEIKEEQVEAYLKTVGKNAPEGSVEVKPGESVIYKREKFSDDEWSKLTDDDKKKPGEGKMKELEDKEMIGIKKVKSVNGDEISFEDADFTKKTEDILGVANVKVEGQEDLVKTLGELKTKNPESISKMGDIAKLYQDPDANKDKIAEIEKLLGSEGS